MGSGENKEEIVVVSDCFNVGNYFTDWLMLFKKKTTTKNTN